MDTQIIIMALGAFFVSSFLKGVTGLGFSTVCLCLLATFIDLRLAIPLVFIPSFSSNILVMFQAGRFVDAVKRFWLLYLSALPGLMLGVLFLTSFRNDITKAILGVVILVYGVWGGRTHALRFPEKREKQLLIPVGFISGLLNGATGSQIMPIMPYLLSLKMDRNLFVQTMNSAFTLNTVIMMLWLGKEGILTLPVIYLSAAGILPVSLGIFLGGLIRKKFSDDVYQQIVFLLLIVLGIRLVGAVLF